MSEMVEVKVAELEGAAQQSQPIRKNHDSRDERLFYAREVGMSLEDHIKDHVRLGCCDCSRSLGFTKMPEGYALMLNPDASHFYWLRGDGADSDIHWDKWAVYRGARDNKRTKDGA